MLVIRKGGLEAPERMGGVNNAWAFGNQHRGMRDKATPDARNPKNLDGKSGHEKNPRKEKRKQRPPEIVFLCDDAGSWGKESLVLPQCSREQLCSQRNQLHDYAFKGSSGQLLLLDKMGKLGGQSFPPKKSRDLRAGGVFGGGRMIPLPKETDLFGLPTHLCSSFLFPPRTYLEWNCLKTEKAFLARS